MEAPLKFPIIYIHQSFLDKDNIEKWINIKSKRKVYFKSPKSGEKRVI